MAATVRSVTVRLNADVGKYIADVKAAGAATDSAFSKASVGLGKTNDQLGVARNRLADVSAGAQGANTSLTGVTRGVSGLDRSLTGLDRSSKSVDSSINQLTGRLRLIADLTAVLGPGLIPIAAVGVPALAGMANQLTSMALAGGAVAIAMQGVPDAIGAVAAYDLEPTAANLEAAQAALGQLGPDALAFVGAFREFRPVLGDIRDATAAGVFPGLVESLGNLEDLAPTASRLLRDVGQAAGDSAADVTASLASDRWRGFFDYLREQAPQSIEQTTRTLGDLGHGLGELLQSLDPGADRFETWLGNVADGFDDWASSDQGREDIEQFLDYAATNGPKVAEFFAETADALTDITQAAAPLGGFVLDGLTGVAEAASAIAESDLGTPLLAAAAGLAVYNRGLKVTRALGATAFGSRVSSYTKDVKASIPTVGQFGTVLATAGQSAKYTTDQTNAARASVGSFVRSAAPGVAVVGGLALATTGLGDKFGVTNTASLALMGTLGGPLGVAAGAAIGATLDLAAANDDLVAAMRASQDAVQTGGIDQMRAAYDQLDAAISNASWVADLTGATGIARGELAALERTIDNVKAGSVSGSEALGSLLDPGDASGFSREMEIAAQSVEDFAASFAGLNSALDRSGSLINYEQALDDLTASVKENGNAWDASTEEGRGNLEARNALVGRAIERSNALKEAGDDLGAQRILTRAIGDLRRFGEASPQAKAAMKFLIAELRNLNQQRAKPKVGMDDKEFRNKKRGVEAGTRDLDRRRATPRADLDRNPFTRNYNRVRGDVRRLDGEKANPKADLDDNPFTANYRRTRGDLTWLDRQKPTPTALLNDGPLQSRQNAAMAALFGLDRFGATPSATLIDNATGPAAAIRGAIAAIQSKTVTITVNRVMTGIANLMPGAEGMMTFGGVKAFAGGGMDRADRHLPEFAGPGPTRVWREPETRGESYIPWADDYRRPRAKAITEATAALFGGEVTWHAQGSLNAADDLSERRRARAMRIASESGTTPGGRLRGGTGSALAGGARQDVMVSFGSAVVDLRYPDGMVQRAELHAVADGAAHRAIDAYDADLRMKAGG